MIEPVLREVVDFVSRRAGLSLATMRPAFVETGIRRAMKKAGAAGVADYLGSLAQDEARFRDLVSELTIGETYFFREPGQFELIARDVVPMLRASRPPGHGLRAWSAGCASGEEAYTLAILFDRLGIENHPPILGTDLSASALSKARRGVYGAWSFRGRGLELADSYLHRQVDRFEVQDRVRERVTFRPGNLAEATAESLTEGQRMDLILCRNVLIYFRPEAIARVARTLWDALAEDGWLLTGASDPPLADFAPFTTVLTDSGVHYRRGRAKPSVLFDMRPPALPPAVIVPIQQPVTLEPMSKSAPSALAEALPFEDAETRATRIRMLRNVGDVDAAASAADEAVDRYPTSCTLQFLRAMLMLDLGRLGPAAQAARRAIYLDRKFAMGHLALGAILERAGDGKGAGRSYRTAWVLLGARPAQEIVAFSDGAEAGRLADVARARFQAVTGPAGGLA